MKFPKRPTCHEGERRWLDTPIAWRPFGHVQPYRSDTRRCNYCGSLHPEDLLRALHNGATLSGSDWKYGYPHKFYVHGVPNDYAGQQVEIGSESGRGYNRPIIGAAPPDIPAKFYSQHLLDQGYDDDALGALIGAIHQAGGVLFELRDGGLYYRAPYPGYQHVPELGQDEALR